MVSGGLVHVCDYLGADDAKPQGVKGDVGGDDSCYCCGGFAPVRRRDLYPMTLDRPVIDWLKVRFWAGALAVCLLFWAAVYELVRW
jgi:hypothetical protein